MRVKSKIIRVGVVIEYADGSLEPRGWHMDGGGKSIMLELATDGQMYFGGWSVKELREIESRPLEFIEMELPT